MDKGRKVWYDENLFVNPVNCYNTYISNDANKCKSIFKCLLDEDPKTLKDCIQSFADDNLWTLAKEDLCKVGPDTIRKLLKKFCIERNADTGRTEDYEHWLASLESKFDATTATIIRSNTRLLGYIQGIIEMVNAENLLGETINIAAEQQRFDKLPVKQWVSFPQSSQRENSNDDLQELLSRVNLMSDNYSSYPNVRGMMPIGVGGIPLAQGGGAYASQNGGSHSLDQIEKLCELVNNRLARSNIKSNPNDDKKIDVALKNTRQLQSQIVQLLKRKMDIAEFVECLGCDRNVDPNGVPTTLPPLSTLRTRNQIEQWARNYCKKTR
jgi:hypothetical protein